LVIGFAALAAPTFATFAGRFWIADSGSAAPIVIATGGWLLWRNWPEMTKEGRRGQAWLTATILTLALPLYVFGRAYSFALFEAAGLYGVGLAMLYDVFGLRALLKQWFPIGYLAFAIPLPTWVVDGVTAPLKEFVSYAATLVLHAAGLPIAREGVTLTVGQYQLLVEDACSGLNSLFGLIAIGLLYAYLVRRSSPWRFAGLAILIVPIAIVANVIRVMFIVLITYFFGNEAGQSFVHYLAGFVLFGVSLLLIFQIDRMHWPVLGRRGARA
jgi:exosortase B